MSIKERTYATTGDRIRRARLNASLTQQAVADTIGASNRTISNYELGYCLPDRYTADKIAAALNVEYAELFKDGVRCGLSTHHPGCNSRKHVPSTITTRTNNNISSPHAPSSSGENLSGHNLVRRLFTNLLNLIELFGCEIQLSDVATIKFNSDNNYASPNNICQFLSDYIAIKAVSDRQLINKDDLVKLCTTLINKYSMKGQQDEISLRNI